MVSAPTVIAFYLPQFQPTPYNDAWWGPGFTEWTHVAAARPLFRGHAQPRLPGELGFYDLRLPETRAAQADLATSYGVDCFCYWHYWFGGTRLLNETFDDVLASAEPGIKFCLGWANEPWTAVWAGRPDHILIPQTYPGAADDRAHFDRVEPAFHDPRYLRVDGRPVFYVYRPLSHPYLPEFVRRWNHYATESGLPGVFFVAETSLDSLDTCSPTQRQALESVDALVGLNWYRATTVGYRSVHLRRGPLRGSYARTAAEFPYSVRGARLSFPCVLTGWDDTPRKGRRGIVLTNRTSELFGVQLANALTRLREQAADPALLFVKSWNEWAEGNVLEPDRTTGRADLETLATALGRELPVTPTESSALPAPGSGRPGALRGR